MRWYSETKGKYTGLELKLVLFLAYVGALVFLWIKTQNALSVLVSHLLIVFLFSIYYFGREFLFIAIAPLAVIFIPISNFFIRRYLKSFRLNEPAEVVIVLAHSDWSKLEPWIKPNFFLSEIKSIVSYLVKKKQSFSFYTHANLKEVEDIMLNREIKEVYFVGHGSSHVFQLSTHEILYYCEFNPDDHTKEFVHQIHCGTTDGKSLAEYVVPENNRDGCFLIRKTITSFDVEKELKKRTSDLLG